MQGMDISFPSLYHAHHSRHTDDLPFWLGLAARQGGPILELGCGTGRVLQPLTETGDKVVGLDQDAAMLGFLRRRLPPGASAYLLQADLAHFHLAQSFSLILLPCNTYSTLNPEVRSAALERIRYHLAQRGRFAFSIPNPTLLRQLPARSAPELEEIFPHPMDGRPVQVYSAWRRSGDHFTVLWRYDHQLPNGEVEQASVQVRHHLLTPREHLAELRRAGLRVRAVYGDFDRSEYRPDSTVMLIIASR